MDQAGLTWGFHRGHGNDSVASDVYKVPGSLSREAGLESYGSLFSFLSFPCRQIKISNTYTFVRAKHQGLPRKGARLEGAGHMRQWPCGQGWLCVLEGAG